MRDRGARWLVLFLSATACTLPTGSRTSRADLPAAAAKVGPGAPQQPGYHPSEGEWGDRTLIEAILVPSAWMEIDEADPAIPSSEVGSADGVGYGLRAATGNKNQSIGVLYQGFELEADGPDVSIHSVYLDFGVRVPLDEGGGRVALVTGAGLGGAWIDLDPGGDGSRSEGAAQLRVGMEFAPSEGVAVGIGVGGLIIGHFGETEAYGTFFTLGGTFTF